MTATPELGHLQFYADPAKPYFCLEPQSMASGAFNRPSGWTTRTRASACSNPARAHGRAADDGALATGRPGLTGC